MCEIKNIIYQKIKIKYWCHVKLIDGMTIQLIDDDYYNIT